MVLNCFCFQIFEIKLLKPWCFYDILFYQISTGIDIYATGRHGLKNMDRFSSSASDNRRNDTNALTVALISENGAFQTMWLPADMEGRYRFQSSLGLDLPVYMESDGNQWAAFAEKGTDRKSTRLNSSH